MATNDIILPAFCQVIKCYNIEHSPLCWGRLYLFTERTDGLVSESCRIRKTLFEQAEELQFTQHYDVHVVDKEYIATIPELVQAVNNGYNIIIPLYTPNEPSRSFLVANISSDKVDYQLPTLINYAEQVSNEATLDAFINFTIQEPDTCKIMFEDLFSKSHQADSGQALSGISDNGILGTFGAVFAQGICSAMSLDMDFDFDIDANYSESSVDSDSPKVYGIAPSKSKGQQHIIHRKSLKDDKLMYEHFMDNCKKYYQLEMQGLDASVYKSEKDKLLKELKFVLKEAYSVTSKQKDFIKMLMTYFNDYDREACYENLYNRYSIAEKCTVHIGVQQFDAIDTINKNDGLLRIFVEKDGQKTFLHFGRKPSFVVYLIYLIDAYNRNSEMTALPIDKYKDVFCELFEMTYREKGNIEFENLKKKVLKGDTRPVQLKDCISDIKTVFEQVFESMGILSERLPFIIPNEKSHMTARKNNISLIPALETMAI